MLKSILKELGDNHSIFLSKEEFENMDSTCKKAAVSEVITFSGKLLDQNIGYLHLRGFNTTDSINSIIYADSLQNLIKSIDNRNIKGWILDLRENTGGSCWPMLAGLGPLLGNGICGYGIDNNHKKSSWFTKMVNPELTQ